MLNKKGVINMEIELNKQEIETLRILLGTSYSFIGETDPDDPKLYDALLNGVPIGSIDQAKKLYKKLKAKESA
jgi:hypothetical protein